MNATIDQICNRLKEELPTLEAGIRNVKSRVESAGDCTVDSLDLTLSEARAALEAGREKAETASRRIREFVEETAKEAVSKFEDWKTDREIAKLEKTADKMEEHAIDAILMAANALIEAEVAIVEALKARKIAIEVAG